MRLFDDIIGSAMFSPCGKYRYWLRRVWGEGPFLNMLMLNPSTADENVNDPTISRCIARAVQLGFSGLVVTNLFAFRSTDPVEMKRAKDPIGRGNDEEILNVARCAECVICGWGEHGTHLDRSRRVVEMLRGYDVSLHALKINESGEPAHPLYLPYNLTPFPFGESP